MHLTQGEHTCYAVSCDRDFSDRFCSFKCSFTFLTIFGWKICFRASSSVISIGCFFDFFFDMVLPMKEAIDLCELVDRYGNDQQCRDYLERLRWKDGVVCPKCLGTKVSSILKRDQYNCDNESCGYQFSVTAGTIFHDTHLPLTEMVSCYVPDLPVAERYVCESA